MYTVIEEVEFLDNPVIVPIIFFCILKLLAQCEDFP